jgi:TonB family protein
MSTAVIPDPDPRGRQLLLSFAFASAVVSLGVLASWIAIQRSGDAAAVDVGTLTLDGLPVEAGSRRASGVRTLLEQADLAWAAGRIVEPQYDNALYFYQSVLDQESAQADALAGVDRVVQWLSGEVSVAVDARDFERARAVASHIALLRPEDEAAQARLARLERIRETTVAARRQTAAGEWLAAARSWRTLARLDAGNVAARDGLRRALEGLVLAGREAAGRGELESARARLADVRAIDPAAPGADALAERIEVLDRQRSGADRGEALAAVRAAIDAGRLVDGGPTDAFTRIAGLEGLAVPAAEIDALRGAAVAALMRLGEREAAAGRVAEAERVLARARAVGVADARLAPLAAELDHARYLADFRAGRYDELWTISQLTVVERQNPEFSRLARTRTDGGWAEVGFTVSADGRVRDARVRDASSSLFSEPSLEAIQGWRFAPVLRDGRPVPVRAAIRFTFRS